MDCSPPGSSVHGIFQARTLEWAAISSSRGSSWPSDRTQVSCFADRRFIVWAPKEALRICCKGLQEKKCGFPFNSLTYKAYDWWLRKGKEASSKPKFGGNEHLHADLHWKHGAACESTWCSVLSPMGTRGDGDAGWVGPLLRRPFSLGPDAATTSSPGVPEWR